MIAEPNRKKKDFFPGKDSANGKPWTFCYSSPSFLFPFIRAFSFSCHKGVWGGVFTWLQTPNCNFLLILNEPIFAGEIAGNLFQVNKIKLCWGKVENINLWCVAQYWPYYKACLWDRPGHFQLWCLLPEADRHQKASWWGESRKALLSSVNPRTILMASAPYPGCILEIPRELAENTDAWAPSQRFWINLIALK